MRLLDFLTSTKRPLPGTLKMSQQEVLDRLESLNRPTEPYRLIDGRSESVDLIAEWKIVDAQWCEAFAKSGLSKVFRIYLKLDPANHEVRAIDREYTVEWRAGVPSTLVAVGRFRGQMQSRESSKAYVFTRELGLHEVYNYRFSTKELKGPIQDAVTSCGWTYKGVVFGKL